MMVRYAVEIDGKSLSRDTRRGVVSQRYKYSIKNTDIHALVQIEQDALKSASERQRGSSAKRSFEAELKFSRKKVAEIMSLGDQAFVVNGSGQVHMLYRGYYTIVAFTADLYTDDKNADLNTRLTRQILGNLQRGLGIKTK